MNIHADIPLIKRVSDQLREMLGEDFDDETFLDTLDGETDAMDIADRLIASMQDDTALSAAAKAEAAAIDARAKRIGERAEAKKRALFLVLDATGEKKLERPRATISRRSGSMSVSITDEKSIPSQLCKTTVTPDKTAIKKQLEAGEIVPGAELVRGADGITVRVK